MISEICRARWQDPTGLNSEYWDSVLNTWEAYIFAARKEIFVSQGLGFGAIFVEKLRTDLDLRVMRFLKYAVFPPGHKHSRDSDLWREVRFAAREKFGKKGKGESLDAYKERLRGIYRHSSR
jgi:hypothetical protein